jgi:hypothetical protein
MGAEKQLRSHIYVSFRRKNILALNAWWSLENSWTSEISGHSLLCVLDILIPFVVLSDILYQEYVLKCKFQATEMEFLGSDEVHQVRCLQTWWCMEAIKISTGDITGARGSVVVKALCYKRKVAGSIPYEVIFKFT